MDQHGMSEYRRGDVTSFKRVEKWAWLDAYEYVLMDAPQIRVVS